MRHGSLFSGIGGFDLAAEWMGWENVFHCELNEFGQKVLKHYWPNAISYGDITKTDFNVHRGEIDILTGGFPCQPYSTAGKRRGKEDDRHLWPEMLRAIREIQPGWVVGENVFGLVNWSRGLVFHEVQTNLEAEGYEVFPYVLPACAKNAPHRRDRVWFIAYSENFQRDCKRQEKQQCGTGRIPCGGINGNALQTIAANPECHRPQRSWGAERSVRSKTNENWEASWTYPNDRWPTEHPLRRGNDGLSKELYEACLTAYGNSIVPQVAYEIFKAIDKCNT